jgi:hypothetical protein
MISLREGDTVSFVGDGMDGIVPATGTLLAFASISAAHVKWSTGPRRGEIDICGIYDLLPAASAAALESAAVAAGTMPVRRVYAAEGETGVVNYLSHTAHVAAWSQIARDAHEFVTDRLKADSSLDRVWEELEPAQVSDVARLAAAALLRDAFGSEDVEA